MRPSSTPTTTPRRGLARVAVIALSLATLLPQLGASDAPEFEDRLRDLVLCGLAAAWVTALSRTGWRYAERFARRVRVFPVVAAALVFVKTLVYDFAWTFDDTGVPGETPGAPWTAAEIAIAAYLTAAVVLRRSPISAVALLIGGAVVDCWSVNTRGYTLPGYLLSANIAVIAAVLRAVRSSPNAPPSTSPC